MKFLKTILPLLLISPSLAYYDVLNRWSESDLRSYLKDNDIAYAEKSPLQELKDLASKHWNEIQYHSSQEPWYNYGHIKQKVLNLYEGRPLNAPPSGSAAEYYDTVKDWVFSTWSEADLKRFLRKSKIKYHVGATQDELVKLARDNYDSVSSKAKASGKYLGDWLYDSWDTEDLKAWLDQYKIEYDDVQASRDLLVKKVREHAYEASKYTAEERESILDSLDLSAKHLFDKAGQIKGDVFNTMSASQLYRWLQNHQIKIDESIKNNKDELALVAQKHKEKFHKDVDEWTARASKAASPLLSKATGGVDNLINDTFLVGVESWSRDRLKSFLEARGVKPSFFTTKKELVELVKKNKFKPIENYNAASFFEGWSKSNIEKWISDQNDAVSANANDFAERTNDLYKSFLGTVGYYKSQAQDTIASAQQSVQDTAEGIHDKAKDLNKEAQKKASNAAKQAKGTYNQASKDSKEAVNKASQGAADAVDKAGADIANIKDQFFDYWSDIDLENYLTSFGIKAKRAAGKKDRYSRDELIKLAKQNTRWFLTGETYDTTTTSGQIRSCVEEIYSRTQHWLRGLFYSLCSALGVVA